ncbi:MAG TPA: outer membrane beta-barrel protein [Urbifossiella sp.]|nr:outer membrane beta-barrel protein [Urbifossiella sp.]
MFTSLLLTTAVAAGQPPAGYYPPGTLPTRAAPVQIPIAPRYVAQQGQPGTLPPSAQPMPGGEKAAPMTPADAAGAGPAEEGPKEEEAPEKYLLERTIEGTRFGELLNNRGITVYGWTQLSYSPSTASGSNAPIFMNDRANEFLMNQNYLVAEKTLDTEKDCFQWGWRMDWILPGSDYRTTLPRGIWNGQLTRNNGGPELYGFDPFQFYTQAYLPGSGTTVKLGRFATHVGYELVQAVDTPFVSRSYMFQYNPFTHTGVWATTPVGDNWTVGYGAATGSDTFIDAPTNRLTFLGQLKWAPKDGDTSVAVNTVVTNPKYIPAEAFAHYNFYNLVVTQKLGEKLSYVLDAGYSHMNDAPGVGFTEWYGAAQYLIYAHNDCFTSTLRVELFDDTDGFRTGFRGLYTSATYGLAYKPLPGLMVRPFARYDNNNRTEVWEGNQNLFTGGLDVIFRW